VIGRFMVSLNDTMQKNMQSGDMSLLAETHATSSGLKAVTTWIGAAGVEECRRACGGCVAATDRPTETERERERER
jgi:acyl-CoA oxidase